MTRDLLLDGIASYLEDYFEDHEIEVDADELYAQATIVQAYLYDAIPDLVHEFIIEKKGDK
jgi:hypothetical protein